MWISKRTRFEVADDGEAPRESRSDILRRVIGAELIASNGPFASDDGLTRSEWCHGSASLNDCVQKGQSPWVVSTM